MIVCKSLIFNSQNCFIFLPKISWEKMTNFVQLKIYCNQYFLVTVLPQINFSLAGIFCIIHCTEEQLRRRVLLKSYDGKKIELSFAGKFPHLLWIEWRYTKTITRSLMRNHFMRYFVIGPPIIKKPLELQKTLFL